LTGQLLEPGHQLVEPRRSAPNAPLAVECHDVGARGKLLDLGERS
jgi:hypothetical protein